MQIDPGFMVEGMEAENFPKLLVIFSAQWLKEVWDNGQNSTKL